MRVKVIGTIILAAALSAICGCRDAPVPHGKVWRLAQTHPLVKQMCDKVGSCEDIDFTCTVYDGTGNSDLRNTTVVFFEAAKGDRDVRGYAFADNGEADIPRMIDEAAREFVDRWNQPDAATVYPNGRPCDDAACR